MLMVESGSLPCSARLPDTSGISTPEELELAYLHVFLYYNDGSLPWSVRLPDTSGISTPEELTGLPTCFSFLQ
jgi:isopropylmalate/homocitrate/citramalate synthase